MDPQGTVPTVILRQSADYDVEAIRRIVREGLRELGLTPFGRTLVKPNLVNAGPLFQHAHTRQEFVEGVLLALQDRKAEDPGEGPLTELAVGERCGLTVPTRYVFHQAGYDPMLQRVGAKRYCFDEEPQVEIPLTHPGRLRDYLYAAEPVARADFFVNCPKFKANPWSTVTFSMKNYIGIQDDRHRVIDHDHRLGEKIADLQYVIQPKFIAIDGIIAGEGRMLTPSPFPLHLIVMGNNQPAVDAVCSAIIGLRAADIEHIRLASERGFGPIDLERIRMIGDLTLDELRERARGFKVGLVRVEKYFEGTNISAYAGPPPTAHSDSTPADGHADYCLGGCPGSIAEAIEVIRLSDPQTDAKMPHVHLVFGNYQGPLPVKPGEKVIFIGDCAQWKGDIAGELVDIRSGYRNRSTKDPRHARHSDIFGKILRVAARFLVSRNKRYVQLKGCPVTVAEQIMMLVTIAGMKNPYLDPTVALPFNKSYLAWRVATAVKRLRGVPYQKRVPTGGPS